MFFMIRRPGRPARLVGTSVAGIPFAGLVPRALATAMLGVALCTAGLQTARAQQAGSTGAGSPSFASLSGAAIASQVAAGAANGNAAQPTVAPITSAGGQSSDPVSRFLSEKGLLPNTRPVVELAQQVRDKATDVASELVMSAMNFLGVPYKRGGNSRESGFDCSGFTRHVFENSVGLILPRRASEQANSPDLVPVQKSELKPGDLVFFNTLRRTFSHVGIYIGNDKFIHSPRAGGQVRVEDMRQSYWQQRYDGARRAPLISAGQSAGTPGN